MSMNLHLVFKDEKGRSVKHVDLAQTPTDVTYDILSKETFEEQLLSYIKYVSKFDDSNISDIPSKFYSSVKESMNEFGLSEFQAKLSMATIIDNFLPFSLREYKRLDSIISEYSDDYIPEFIAL